MNPTMPREARLGSISEGTLRTADLLGNFAYELAHIATTAAHIELVKEAQLREEELISADARDETDWDSECVTALIDALNELAPPYCTFGASEGDGASFGFWPSMEAIEELPRVADPADVPDGGTGEDCAYVNDHGNVTVYGADGDVILELV